MSHFDFELDLSHIVSELLSLSQLQKTFESENESKINDKIL